MLERATAWQEEVATTANGDEVTKSLEADRSVCSGDGEATIISAVPQNRIDLTLVPLRRRIHQPRSLDELELAFGLRIEAHKEPTGKFVRLCVAGCRCFVMVLILPFSRGANGQLRGCGVGLRPPAPCRNRGRRCLGGWRGGRANRTNIADQGGLPLQVARPGKDAAFGTALHPRPAIVVFGRVNLAAYPAVVRSVRESGERRAIRPTADHLRSDPLPKLPGLK